MRFQPAKFVRSFAAAIIAMALLAAPAFAADSASPDVADSTTGMIFRWLNFVLVFGGLAYILARYGGPYFRGRGAEIGDAIREASAAKADAERELREIEDQVAHLDREIARLRAESVQEEAAEALRQTESGQREIERIERAAQFEIQASERLARQQLREVAAQMAVDAAEKDLRAALSTDEPARAELFQSFLAQLGRTAPVASPERVKN
jgi:F0F1-type ATP synthase membrane subunit b/b'